MAGAKSTRLLILLAIWLTLLGYTCFYGRASCDATDVIELPPIHRKPIDLFHDEFDFDLFVHSMANSPHTLSRFMALSVADSLDLDFVDGNSMNRMESAPQSADRALRQADEAMLMTSLKRTDIEISFIPATTHAPSKYISRPSTYIASKIALLSTTNTPRESDNPWLIRNGAMPAIYRGYIDILTPHHHTITLQTQSIIPPSSDAPWHGWFGYLRCYSLIILLAFVAVFAGSNALKRALHDTGRNASSFGFNICGSTLKQTPSALRQTNEAMVNTTLKRTQFIPAIVRTSPPPKRVRPSADIAIQYTHRYHASAAQSTWKSNKDLYNPLKQSEHSQNYMQIIGSVAASLCGVFVSQPRAFKVALFIAFNLLMSVRTQYFNCTGSYDYKPCYNIYYGYLSTITCDQENVTANCTVDCIGEEACYRATIRGGAGPLSVNCHGPLACGEADISSAINASTFIDARGTHSLRQANIGCGSPEYCNITARDDESLQGAMIWTTNGTKLFVNATGNRTLHNTRIYCPKDYIQGDSYSNDALCNIYAEGEEVMDDTHIYAAESFYNVQIECDTRSQSISSGGISVLFCAKFDAGQSCPLQCLQNDVGPVEFVDEANCFCANYTFPTHHPTPSPTFSPTKYDPKEESPNLLYVSKNGCDAGPCDSDRFDWSGYEHDSMTEFPTSDPTTEFPTQKHCTTANTVLFNVTGTVTVQHSVSSNVYQRNNPNEQVEVLCFGIDAGQCYRPRVVEVLYENIYYYDYVADAYLNIGYRNQYNLLNYQKCQSSPGVASSCGHFAECPVRTAPLDTVWTAEADPYAFYIINGPSVMDTCSNPKRSMNVHLSLQCGQPCQSVQYAWSCLNGYQNDCSQYDGNGKIKMDVGQYMFNRTIRISNQQIRIDGQSSSQTTLAHHTGNNSHLIDCYFRQCYLTIANLLYDVTLYDPTVYPDDATPPAVNIIKA
eukprot:403698_1